jgi:hypothetical protein
MVDYMKEEICKNCRFFKEIALDKNRTWYICRRYPPTTDNSNPLLESLSYPEVFETYWCGEYYGI